MCPTGTDLPADLCLRQGIRMEVSRCIDEMNGAWNLENGGHSFIMPQTLLLYLLISSY